MRCVRVCAVGDARTIDITRTAMECHARIGIPTSVCYGHDGCSHTFLVFLGSAIFFVVGTT